jgi:hypothetical protein
MAAEQIQNEAYEPPVVTDLAEDGPATVCGIGNQSPVA